MYVFYSSLCLLTFHSTLNKTYYNMSGSRLFTEDSEMNDVVFAVFRPEISEHCFIWFFFNNTLRYVSLSLFQRCKNGLWKFKQLAWGQVVSKWRTWNGSMTPNSILSHASGTGYSLLKNLRQDCNILEVVQGRVGEWSRMRKWKVWIVEERESTPVEAGRQRQAWTWRVRCECVRVCGVTGKYGGGGGT